MMEPTLEFISRYLWAPIVGVLVWFIKDWKQGIDKDIAMLNRKLEKQDRYMNDKLVKKDDLREMLTELRYVRERVDDIATRIPPR